MNATDYNRLLIKIARLYYEKELNQQRIADQLGLSRQKVQRLLKQAKEDGIVRIGITPVMGVYSDLEIALAEHYALKEAVLLVLGRERGVRA